MSGSTPTVCFRNRTSKPSGCLVKVTAHVHNAKKPFVSATVCFASSSDIDWYQKPPGSCSSHLLNPARDRNMQIRRDPYSLESTRLDPRNRGFTRVARGEQPISERFGINKYGVKWKMIAFVD